MERMCVVNKFNTNLKLYKYALGLCSAKDDTWEPASELPVRSKLEFWRDLQKGIGTEPAR